MYLLAPLLLLGKVLTDALARRVKLERMSVVTSAGATLAAVGLGVCSASACAILMDLDLISRLQEVPISEDLALVSVLLLFGFAMLAMSGRTLLRATRFSLGLAVLSSVAFGVILALASARAASLPGVDHYRSELREISFAAEGVLQNPATVGHRQAGLYPTSQGYEEPPRYLPGALGEKRSQEGGLTIVRSCSEEGCRLRISDAGAGPGDETQQRGVLMAWGDSRNLLVDERGGVVYVQRSSAQVERVFERVDGAWVMRDPDVRLVARRASVPVAWLLTSGVLLLFIAVQWSRRRGLVVHRRQLLEARGGVLTPDGTVVFQDLPPHRLEGTAKAAVGPVTVLFDSIPKGEPLPALGTIPSDRVIPGDIAELREVAALRVMTLDMGIIAAASLGIAPLIGAAMTGLVL